ncbi:hypothetical protein [Salinimonas iocasae]|uniref:Uncharacterized protein n=1 Tax=Salinimonas iocasae TaxID=2572577 RepID=A0A5B7YKF6_9ALTE|nr:hypothetical protein [Salinimonas iocasae]QCZ95289.1 hypothetical protein FBQ74_17220 [Salinimonas iocasae]
MFLKGPMRFQASKQKLDVKLNCGQIRIRNSGFSDQISSLYFVVESKNYLYHINGTFLGIELTDDIIKVATLIKCLFNDPQEVLMWAQSHCECKQRICNEPNGDMVECVPVKNASILASGITVPLLEVANGRFEIRC